MGTSSSATGSGSKQPLVPPWADDTPGKPLPQPQEGRFRSFRLAFGDHLAKGGEGGLKKAVGRYAREASGGSGVGPRRFGTAFRTGGDLYDVLSSLAGGGTAEEVAGVDLSGLQGQAMDIACQEIARALAPDNADADMVQVAIEEAVYLAMEDQDEFDIGALDDDRIAVIMGEFLAQAIFHELSAQVGTAWNRSPSEERTTKTEEDLLELVRQVIDQKLADEFRRSGRELSNQRAQEILRQATKETWAEWETYE